jgi:predicted Na+-dependent transporter
VLPLMLFDQVQLIACAALARRYAGATVPVSNVVRTMAEAA